MEKTTNKYLGINMSCKRNILSFYFVIGRSINKSFKFNVIESPICFILFHHVFRKSVLCRTIPLLVGHNIYHCMEFHREPVQRTRSKQE